MSNEWIETTVGEYCSFTYGKAIKKADQKESGIPVYGSNGVYTYADSSLENQSTVIIGRKGSVGKVHLSLEPCWVSDTAFYVSKDSLEESYFVYYLLSSLGLENMNTDAAVPGLNRNNAHRLEIKIPSSSDKRAALVEPLIRLDQKIQLNQQINQTLEAMAQALFKSWFVDFEPTKAKIAVLAAGGNEEDANLAAMQAISGKTAAELEQLKAQNLENYQQLYTSAQHFPALMQDSELGEIPEGWEVEKLEKHVDILNGFAFKSGDYEQDGVFVLRTKNFSNDGVVEQLSDDVYLPEEFLESHSKYLCKPFDHHLVMVGASVGKTGIIYPHLLPALRNQNMWCFRTKDHANTSQVFIKYLIDIIAERSLGIASGSARAFFRKGDFQKQLVCFGSKKIQHHFKLLAFSLLKMQANNTLKNINLMKVRDQLLPKLLSGELSVADLPQAELA